MVTAEGNEVKDLLGFTEADLMLGNQKKAKAKMLVTIKTLTNITFKVDLTPTDTVSLVAFLNFSILSQTVK